MSSNIEHSVLRRLVIAAVVAMAVSSSGQAQNVPRRSAPLRVLYEGTTGGGLGPLRQVIRTADEFARVWRLTHPDSSGPADSVPHVDFRNRMVIVASMGFQSGHGGRITVTDVHDRGNVVDIAIDVRMPTEPCPLPSEIQHPVIIVEVSTTHSTPVFRDRFVAARC